MVVVGAKGFAKEVLEILAQHDQLTDLFFFDDVTPEAPDKFFGFPVLTTLDAAAKILRTTSDKRFTLGLGQPALRYKLHKTFIAMGGEFTSTISLKTDIGRFGITIGEGCNILGGTVITSNVSIGKGCLINPCCSVSHDSVIGDFVEMGPGVRITGNCHIGNFSVLGTNAVVLPKIRVGNNVTVGAGAVVTRNVPDNTLVAGVPAIVKRTLQPWQP